MPKVFISYSHADEKWKNMLQSHLDILDNQDVVEVWDDRQIKPGDDWLNEISLALDSSCIAIMLVSRHFLTSDFIKRKEIPALLKRRQDNGLKIFPLIVSHCPWQIVDWLQAMQGMTKDNLPLERLEEA